MGDLGWIISPLTLASCLMILFGAIMMYVKPEKNSMWGVTVIIFSAIGFMGGMVFPYLEQL